MKTMMLRNGIRVKLSVCSLCALSLWSALALRAQQNAPRVTTATEDTCEWPVWRHALADLEPIPIGRVLKTPGRKVQASFRREYIPYWDRLLAPRLFTAQTDVSVTRTTQAE